MNENGKKKREWVKTAAIVFLSVMLVLTFFSNTIQNYSLPEVATQYVQSGTITAKIRGTGTVESGDPYEVKVTETRKVASVAVRTGDTVQKGDVLVYLEDTDSDELKAAKEALEKAQSDYSKALLDENISVSDIAAANNGVSTDTYRSQITIAQNAVKAAEKEIEPWNDEVARIQQLISDCQAQVSYEQSLNSTAPERVTKAQKAKENALAERDSAESGKADAERKMNAAQAAFDSYYTQYHSVSEGDAVYEDTLEELRNQKDSAIENYNNAKSHYEDRVNAYNDAVNEYNDAVRNQTEREQSQSVVNLTNAIAGFNIDLHNAQKELQAAKDRLTEKQTALKELLSKIGNVTGLETYLTAIEKAQKQVDELTAKTTNATITAPISGTISSINVTAGNNTSAATPVVVMQPEGKGYTLSFSVTNDQAKRLSVGDKADLVNAWRYDDVTVTLASIKPDTSNPGQKKILTFDVTGNVVAGQSLSLSVGQKSANYDYIVPNSAIREDNNGKFILIVESKQSPLGTRYTASRVDVEVIASDDTQSAISGGLYGYEFVITTSTKPVEAGKLVRLPN